MRTTAFSALAAALLLLAGCAYHSRDFIPNGAGVNLEPTNPAHIQVLDSIPRGMIIGTVLVDRAKAKNTSEIIEQARQQAAAHGADLIVWEDSLGTAPAPTPTPAAGTGPGAPPATNGNLGHGSSLLDEPPPEQMTNEKTPKARFTIGIFLPQGRD